MKLTLGQAATALGKTRRQLVYLIEQGRLPAEKVGGRWYLDSVVLERDPATARRLDIKNAMLKDAVEDALLPSGKQRHYSLKDIKAFQIAHPLYQGLRQRSGAPDLATAHLHECLRQLAQGCHRYGRAEKTRAYQAARDAASLAVLELMLLQDRDLEGTIDALEQDLMPAIAGLLGRLDRCEEALA